MRLLYRASMFLDADDTPTLKILSKGKLLNAQLAGRGGSLAALKSLDRRRYSAMQNVSRWIFLDDEEISAMRYTIEEETLETGMPTGSAGVLRLRKAHKTSKSETRSSSSMPSSRLLIVCERPAWKD